MATTRIRLADFADGTDVSTEVEIRGRKVKVRDLSLHEKNLLILAHPEPVPPLKKPENKGTDAELVPDLTDKGYAAAMKVHGRELMLLSVAASIDYAPLPFEAGLPEMTLVEAGQANRADKWAAAVLNEWSGIKTGKQFLPEAEIMKLYQARSGLSKVGGVGNSSAPAPKSADGEKPANAS